MKQRAFKTTESYYNKNAQNYFDATFTIDMTKAYERFLSDISAGGRILDAGSGSGRDTLEFLRRGYDVEAFDASSRLAKLSSKRTGVDARVLRFQEFQEEIKYDGIWACASLLHVPETELPMVLQKLVRSLNDGGTFYASFKIGNGFRLAPDGRVFTDMNEQRLIGLLKGLPQLGNLQLWRSKGKREFDKQVYWLNFITTKSPRDSSRESPHQDNYAT